MVLRDWLQCRVATNLQSVKKKKKYRAIHKVSL